MVRTAAPIPGTDAAQGRSAGHDLATRARNSLGGVLVVDFALGLGLLWDRYPLPGIGQPVGVPLLVLACLLGATRRPTHRLRHLWTIIGVYGFMLAWAVVVSQLHDLDWKQRATKMVILVAFGLTIAVGRLHVRSVLVGLITGLLINVVLFYAGLTPNQYPPFLTGYLMDKNVAGLLYACMLLLGLLVWQRWPARLLHLSVFGAALLLTGSRTSIAAGVIGLIWVLCRNRVTLVPRLALAGLLIWALVRIENRFARIGLFADREETDWFRHQIELATATKLENSPWYGDGLTTAWVYLSLVRVMYFHNSYAALRVEGGWVMVAVMMLLVVGFGLGALRRGWVSPQLAIAEAAIAVVLVCAWKLGEVFFTTPAFLVLGIAWRLRLGLADLEQLNPHPPDVASEEVLDPVWRPRPGGVSGAAMTPAVSGRMS